jgi:hypothetical protein
MLREALDALVKNIDAGVTTAVFKEAEATAPDCSALRYAREALAYAKSISK